MSLRNIFLTQCPLMNLFFVMHRVPERRSLKKTLAELKNQTVDVPMYIGGEEVRTGKKVAMHPPHEIAAHLGYFHAGDDSHVNEGDRCRIRGKEDMGQI